MVQNIKQISGVNENYKTNEGMPIFREFTKIPARKDDTFEKKKDDKSNNGKFDIAEAGKNFIKGVFSPLTAVIKHPVMTIAMVGVTAAACSLIPVLTPILGIGFGALSVFQLGKGCFDVAKNIKNKEYDNAEKSFNTVGQGTVGTVLSFLGIKQNARIAKEAKLMSELKVNSLSAAQKEAIATEVNNGSYLNALKESVSLFTTKTGLKAAISQFKPSNILQRGKDIINHLFKNDEVTKIKKERMEFKDTAEGKRRAAMTSDEIEAQINSLYKEACDDIGIPEELRPKIEIVQQSADECGMYNSTTHTITINENSYREGVLDLPDLIKHETTHAGEAILRQRLPMDDKKRIITDYLLDKIQHGEKDTLLTGEGNFITGTVKFTPPKLNAQMKADFSKLAQEKLYQLTDYSSDDIIAMVKPLVEKNPEFLKGYNSVDDAVNAMANYAKNQNFRYKLAIKNASGFNTSNIDTSLLKELTEEEKLAAIKSFKEGIDCLESNCARDGGIMSSFGINSDFDQYQFTPEEVLAEQAGNNFEISKLEAQLNKLRSQDNYDIAEEARLLDLIKRSKLIIEYRTKGMEMYRLKTEAFNHPENAELASKVKILQDELSQLNQEISKISVIGLKVYTNEYSTYQVLERSPMGATVSIPYSTTTAADILADDAGNK